jgi:hypothetical protein
LRPLKKLSRPAGRDQGNPADGHGHRAVVAGRSADRPAEQDHAALGEAGNPPASGQGSALQIRLYFRRHLSPTRARRRSDHALLRYSGHDAAS